MAVSLNAKTPIRQTVFQNLFPPNRLSKSWLRTGTQKYNKHSRKLILGIHKNTEKCVEQGILATKHWHGENWTNPRNVYCNQTLNFSNITEMKIEVLIYRRTRKQCMLIKWMKQVKSKPLIKNQGKKNGIIRTNSKGFDMPVSIFKTRYSGKQLPGQSFSVLLKYYSTD